MSRSALSRALPHAKLTAHDPHIVQVVTAPKPYLARGDIGVKSNVEVMMNDARTGRTGNVRYVQVKNIDNPNGIGLEWKEREQQVLSLAQWRELNVPTYSEHEQAPQSGSAFEMLDTETRTYGSAMSSNKDKAFRLPISSRFDRGSVRSVPKASSSSSSSSSSAAPLPEQPSSLALSEKDLQQSHVAVIPQYSLMSNRDFERLLDFVRSNREEFLQQKVSRIASARRKAKLDQAVRAHKKLLAAREDQAARGASVEEPLPPTPSLDHFPLQVEIEAARKALSSSSAADADIDPLVNPLDLFNLARTTNNAEMASFIRSIFAKVKLDNPASTLLPRPSSEASQSINNASTRLHPLGGLQFSQPDSVFMDFLDSAVPAHVIGTDTFSGGRNDSFASHRRAFLAAVGSRLVTLKRLNAPNVTEVDWRRENKEAGSPMIKFKGHAILRSKNPELERLPNLLRFAASNAAWDKDLAKLNLGYIKAEAKSHTSQHAKEVQDIKERPSKNIVGSRDWHVDNQRQPPPRPVLQSYQATGGRRRGTQRSGGLFSEMDATEDEQRSGRGGNTMYMGGGGNRGRAPASQSGIGNGFGRRGLFASDD